MQYLGLLVVLGSAILVIRLVYRRPQRGLLILAALAPLNGLLAIAPLPSIAAGWKEGLVAVTLICAVLKRRHLGPSEVTVQMPWWPAALGLVAFGVVSAFTVYGPIGAIGLKVTFFYLVIIAILWMTPFDAHDRDHLVSVMMVLGLLTTAVGIAQQVLGPARLLELGYSYGDQIRSSGSLLRTFSTFNQPFGFGLFVMMALLVGGAVALADPHRTRNRIFLYAWPVMAVTMATSVVRAAILGLILGVVWLAVVRFRYLLPGLVAFVVVVVAAVPLLPSSVTSSFFSSSSLNQRSSGWSDIISSIAVHPFGRGLGSSGSAADRMSTAQGDTTRTVTAAANGAIQGGSANYQPDNYYVKMLLELGPIGLWLFLAMVITALIWCHRAGRRLPGQDGAFATGVGASLVAALAACLVSTYFEIFPLDLYFWLLLGAVGCATAQHDSPSARSRSDPRAAESRPISAS